MSSFEQSRHLATPIPGPRSQRLNDRKAAAVSRGVGNTMPVYAARAFGGIVEDADGFLPAVHEWCRPHGVVFIADEVQTGFARTGAMFACEHEGVEPDLIVIVIAKGIADGPPLSAVTGRAEIMDAPHVSGLGGTYGGNPPGPCGRTGDDRHHRVAAPGGACAPHRNADEEPAGANAGRGRPHRRRPGPDLVRAVCARCHAAGVIVPSCGTFGKRVALRTAARHQRPPVRRGS